MNNYFKELLPKEGGNNIEQLASMINGWTNTALKVEAIGGHLVPTGDYAFVSLFNKVLKRKYAVNHEVLHLLYLLEF